jgi:hypothetical protein
VASHELFRIGIKPISLLSFFYSLIEVTTNILYYT